MKKKVVEFFAGARCMGTVAESLGMEVFSIDWENYDGINLVADIGDLSTKDIPFTPDHVHASFDCTTYSIAACSTHRTDSIIPKSEYAIKCDQVNQNVISMIKKWLLVNPNMTISFENPRGMLRKMPFMIELESSIPNFRRDTVWYCQYGDDRAKPTDIWTNSKTWIPRPVCKNGNPNCNHQRAPRGSKTGTQGRKNSYTRSMIPKQLCIELLNSI